MIIAINGTSGAGKDILGNFLIKELSSAFPNLKIKKFAEGVYSLFEKKTGKKWQELDRKTKEELRPKMIEIAENYKKIKGQDVFAKSLLNEYTPNNNWIITDLRFPVEYNELIKKDNVFLIKLLTKNYTKENKSVDTLLIDDVTYPFDYIIEYRKGNFIPHNILSKSAKNISKLIYYGKFGR